LLRIVHDPLFEIAGCGDNLVMVDRMTLLSYYPSSSSLFILSTWERAPSSVMEAP
jgi:hypothetical protein